MEDYYKIALGVLKYTPEQFRFMTLEEFKLALDGHAEATGAKGKNLMSRNDLLDLMGK